MDIRYSAPLNRGIAAQNCQQGGLYQAGEKGKIYLCGVQDYDESGKKFLIELHGGSVYTPSSFPTTLFYPVKGYAVIEANRDE